MPIPKSFIFIRYLLLCHNFGDRYFPGADLVEELLPVLALGPLVRADDLNHVGGSREDGSQI